MLCLKMKCILPKLVLYTPLCVNSDVELWKYYITCMKRKCYDYSYYGMFMQVQRYDYSYYGMFMQRESSTLIVRKHKIHYMIANFSTNILSH